MSFDAAHNETVQRVLFLCTGNYYRSRFAEILFNHLAAERGLPWRADSRGLNIDAEERWNVGPLSPHTRHACYERGLALPTPLRSPQAAGEDDFRGARLVIAVKESEHRPYVTRLFPAWADRVRYWAVHDLDAATAEEAIAGLERLVRDLVEELHVNRNPPGGERMT
jgi:protein-tyrosine phosphatase